VAPLVIMAGCSLSRQAWRACGVPPVTPAPVRRVPLRKSRQRSCWDHFRWSASTRADEEVPQELRRVLLVCLCESSRSQPSPTPGIAVGSITWKKVRHSPAPSIPPSSAAPPRPRRPRRTSGEPRRGLRIRLRPAARRLRGCGVGATVARRSPPAGWPRTCFRPTRSWPAGLPTP
jgi:hypothetical protein